MYLYKEICMKYMYILFIQYYTTTGIPDRQLEPNICAVCGNVILVQDNSNAIVEKTYNLSCGHTYPFQSYILFHFTYLDSNSSFLH